MGKPWSATTSNSEAHRRAGGRRHYNAVRQLKAAERQLKVSFLLMELGWRPGIQATIARSLGVSEATISRDMKTVMPQHLKFCPTCRCFRGFGE